MHDRLYIGGEWVKPAGDETIAVLNPATEEEIAPHPRRGQRRTSTVR